MINIDFSAIKSVTIPEGNVKKIEIDGATVWEKSASRLPSEYQEVEYIESTGTQYIDIGVVGKIGIRILAEMGWRTLSNPLFGSRKDGGATRFFVTYYAGRIDFGICDDSLTTVYPQTGQIYKIDFNTTGSRYSAGVDGIYWTGNYRISEFNTECNMFIFGANRPYTSNQLSKSIFKSMIITNANGETLRDFVPCYRKSDGEIGLYDIENNVFYTNNGTGNFIKGQDI